MFFLFLLTWEFKGENQERSSSLEREVYQKNCLFLIFSPSFEEGKGSGEKNFLTRKAIKRWVSSLKNRFKTQVILFYLPLHRTKDNRWLIAGENFFSTPTGPVKISHKNFSDIFKLLGFSLREGPVSLKDFLSYFPGEKLFLEVFETDERKAGESLSQLVQTPVFITSDNEKLLRVLSYSKNFKTFYSLRYLMRFQFLRIFQREMIFPGSGLVIPYSFSPSLSTLEKIKKQGQMVFLKSLGSFPASSSPLKAPVDGFILSSSSFEKFHFQNPLCSRLDDRLE